MRIRLISGDPFLSKLCREVLLGFKGREWDFGMIPSIEQDQGADLLIWDLQPEMQLPQNPDFDPRRARLPDRSVAGRGPCCNQHRQRRAARRHRQRRQHARSRTGDRPAQGDLDAGDHVGRQAGRRPGSGCGRRRPGCSRGPSGGRGHPNSGHLGPATRRHRRNARALCGAVAGQPARHLVGPTTVSEH